MILIPPPPAHSIQPKFRHAYGSIYIKCFDLEEVRGGCTAEGYQNLSVALKSFLRVPAPYKMMPSCRN